MNKFLTSSILLLSIFALPVLGQTTSFTFQGRLTDTSVPASGTYQMQFSLYDALSGGTQIGSTITNNSVAVSGGVFTVTLDFSVPAAFDGGSRFIQIAVKKPADPTFTPLTPRQPVTSSPYSIKSLNAGTADNSLMLGGQPPASYGTSAQISALQSQITSQQSFISQLQTELNAAAGGNHLWSRQMGSTGSDQGYSVAVDAAGDVFVAGYFEGGVNFGGGVLTSAGSSDIFVAKYSGATGYHIWSKRFGGTLADVATSIAVDSAGNVFLTGYFESTSIDFGGVPFVNAGASDVFIAKLSGANSSHIWSRRFGSGGFEQGYSLVATSSGDVYLMGEFAGTVDFGGLLLTSAGGSDIFIAKYSGGTSSHIWSKRFGGTLGDFGYRAAVDSSENVFAAGWFQSSAIDFGGGALSNANPGGNDVFIAKFASGDGSHVFSRRFGGASDDRVLGLGVDSTGSPMLTGYFVGGSIDLGGGLITGAGSYDVFLAKYGSGGSHQWSKVFGGVDLDFVNSLTVDSSGDPTIIGYFIGNTNLGGPTLNSAGLYDIFVSKHSGVNGATRWSKRFGNSGNDVGYGVATDPAGNVAITGYFQSSTIDFGGGPLVNGGTVDVFSAKLRR